MPEHAETAAVEPTPIDLVRELRRAVGLFDGAMAITPKQAWEEALERVRLLKSGACWRCMEKEVPVERVSGTMPHTGAKFEGPVLQIKLDPNPCIAGWGPCIWGFAHACNRGGGHTGSHHCGQCDARTKDRPGLWEHPTQSDGPRAAPAPGEGGSSRG